MPEGLHSLNESIGDMHERATMVRKTSIVDTLVSSLIVSRLFLFFISLSQK